MMGLVYIMSLICAFCVANIYYSQPILMIIADSIGVTHTEIGNIPTIVQLSYAAGLLLLVPLGDKLNRKNLLQTLLFINLLSSILASISDSFILLELASFFIGVTSIGAQIIIPAAPSYVDANNRGKAVGILLSGLVTGILLARLLSGYIGGIYGWRAVFYFAAFINLFNMSVIYFKFPSNKSNKQISYKNLITSTFELVVAEKELRRCCLSGFVIFGAYSALWGIVAYLTSLPPFYLTSHEVGLLGLSGIAGIIASPYVGRLADKYTPGFVVAIGGIISFIGFVVMYYSVYSIIILVLSMVLLDISARHSIIGNQLRAFSLREDARSRLNTAFMTSYFLGGAVGTKLGSLLGGIYGWLGLVLLGCIASIIAIMVNHKNLFDSKNKEIETIV
ncbi:MAG: transporter [Firmicutes bacterium]|nr:transporter [Bacillota bacterium]